MNANKVTPDLEKPDFDKTSADLMWSSGLGYGNFISYADYTSCKEMVTALQKELSELKAWKESAIQNFIDPIINYGQSAGFKLGSSITEGTIQRAKERDSLKSELEEAKKEVSLLKERLSRSGQQLQEPPF